MKPQVSGDVQGLPLGSQLVTAIQGRAVSATPPQVGDSLVWNGTAWTSEGPRIALETQTTAISTAGTTFATGADLLSAAIRFTAMAGVAYIIKINAAWWSNTAIGQNALRLNLDGADGGYVSLANITVAGATLPCAGAVAFSTTTGVHAVNIRLTTGAGTATVQGGASGTGVAFPILVTLERGI